MMNTLYFGNDGEFDVRSMLTFGVSAKDNDSAIGYFGTGFKYAVAIVLRLGGSISILTNGNKYEFTASREEVRGKEFEFVKMNGKDAGFTTRLGINWQPWQAFRELYCNCKDEGGQVSLEMPNHETIVAVRCDEILKAYHERAVYFIGEGKPMEKNSYAEIYPQHGHFVFYRGVAVMQLREPSIFTYNLMQGIELTEDRTAKSEWSANYYMSRAIQDIRSPEMMRKVLTASPKTYEHGARFDADYSIADDYVEIATHLLKSGIGVSESMRTLLRRIDEKKGNWPEVELSTVKQKMLDKAVSFLAKMDLQVNQFPIKVVDGLGDGVMGRALDGVIYISPMAFNMGTKQVASTLMEEYVHIRHGVADFDRAMQNWLFDKILSLGEEINGEPL